MHFINFRVGINVEENLPHNGMNGEIVRQRESTDGVLKSGKIKREVQWPHNFFGSRDVHRGIIP